MVYCWLTDINYDLVLHVKTGTCSLLCHPTQITCQTTKVLDKGGLKIKPLSVPSSSHWCFSWSWHCWKLCLETGLLLLLNSTPLKLSHSCSLSWSCKLLWTITLWQLHAWLVLDGEWTKFVSMLWPLNFIPCLACIWCSICGWKGFKLHLSYATLM